jgi:uroporphyrinogen-III synthase
MVQSLSGKTIVVTSPGSLAERLRREGANVIEARTIEIIGGAYDEVTVPYDWVAYTSANAAGVTPPHGARVAAVGPATADALRARGVEVALVPPEAIADSLVAAFPAGPGRVLVPQAERARPTLVEGLRAKGWTVDVLTAYSTRSLTPDDGVLDRARAAEAVTFLSASATDAWPLDATPPVVVCIGPVTADAARVRGIEVTAIADPHTIDGVIAALEAVLA